ncbi:MAG: carbohydrate-binding protein [Methylococcales bacterium]
MRKIILAQNLPDVLIPLVSDGCLDLEQLAQIEISSEAADYPIESALLSDSESGWRAAVSGDQIIRVIFDRPLTIKHIRLHFNEPDCSRTQEFVLRWSSEDGVVHEILRQQYHFSPPDTISEIEDYTVNLPQLKLLELTINPDISNGNAIASLKSLQLWQNDNDGL